MYLYAGNFLFEKWKVVDFMNNFAYLKTTFIF